MVNCNCLFGFYYLKDYLGNLNYIMVDLVDKNIVCWQTLEKSLVKAITVDSINVVQIAGSVAVGKTTFAKQLQTNIKTIYPNMQVVCMSTDNFLFNNKQLDQLGLRAFKGFPASYNKLLLTEFFACYQANKPLPKVPVYSHNNYDHILDEYLSLAKVDLLILEGVIALNPNCLDKQGLGLFLDADLQLVKNWYVNRFLQLCGVSSNTSYFNKFIGLSIADKVAVANKIWLEINQVNWYEHIINTRQFADLIITKGLDHGLVDVKVLGDKV